MKLTRSQGLTLFCIFIFGCATYKPQYKSNHSPSNQKPEKEVAHTFYLLGDGGNALLNESTKGLSHLKKELATADKNATLVFLGDNVYPKGIPKKKTTAYALAKHRLDVQIHLGRSFKGRTIFIPGNHDWYNGLDGLKAQEQLVEKALGKNSFLPENGCPIKKVDITDDIVLLVIDTQWYLTDWNKHPKLNDNCEIKTRKKFFDELESQLKKARGKTTILAMHHPMFTQGPHAGNYDFKSHLSPLPLLGTLKNILRKTTGVSNADLQNNKYNTLKKRIVTLAQENERTIFVSGHEHSLQYLVSDHIPQIVSGSGSKESATKLSKNSGLFSYGKQGFAKLTVYSDGSSYVEFFANHQDNPVYETTVFNTVKPRILIAYPNTFAPEKKASIYSKEEITKGKAYRYFWGERYRSYYGTEITAPTVTLDTLYGGLTPVRKGGGHQSRSLRLETADGRTFVMRALRKNALQYLQSVAFKDQYIEGQFNNTYTENLLQDAFTGAHPYTPFVVGTLSDAVGIYHTNPTLYYVPKQPALKAYNTEFGDELYMIEPRAASGHGDRAHFGYANTLISTDDLLKELHKDERNSVDQDAYIKARLFDMLIGDWDRHEDQWRWAAFKEGKKTVYKPVPRDRDQAFSIMADGALMNIATRIMTSLALMKSYDGFLKDVSGFNVEPYPLDMALITEASLEDWIAQATYIQQNLSDETIEKAFENLPKEVQDNSVEQIKTNLKGRRSNLVTIAKGYFKHLNKVQVVKGTDKDDWFDIVRLASGETSIIGYRIKKGKKADIIHQKTYKKQYTKEIWVYGLDDDDVFVVKGSDKNPIKIRIIGGQNHDTYTIEQGKNVLIYDYKSKKNTWTTNQGRKRLSDHYATNVYDPKKLQNNQRQFLPSIGSNPDDGLKIGLLQAYIHNGFKRNPFTYKHTFSGAYYLATQGFDIQYQGEFAHVIGKANLRINSSFTSPNFATNFFGYGNESINLEPDNESIDKNYNRVKLRQVNLGTSLVWKGELASLVEWSINYKNVEVHDSEGRFISNNPSIPQRIFNHQGFLETALRYHFKNVDNPAFPSLGMETNLEFGHVMNLNETTRFSYLKPSLSFDYKLNETGGVVLATKLGGQVNFGNDFEFFQGARLGPRNGLRGYRFDRFIGKSSFYQSSDIRIHLRKVKTGLAPISLGIYGGFDYGKVWAENLPTGDWNTAVGGGLFFNAAEMISTNLAAFSGSDGLRISFGVGFGF